MALTSQQELDLLALLDNFTNNKKTISDLESAVAAVSDQLLPIERAGATKNISVSDIFDYIVTNFPDATEIIKGFLEIATDAETAAGSATNKALVPSNLASLFNNSDYTTINFILDFVTKNSGALNRKIRMQYGVGTLVSLGNGLSTTQSFTFKSAFSTECIGIIPFALANGNNPTGLINTINVASGQLTASGGTYRVFNSSSATSSGYPAYLAIGY